MPTPTIALGIGSVLYALRKIDGRLHLSEMRMINELPAREPHGEMALHPFFIAKILPNQLKRIMRSVCADSKPTAPISTPLRAGGTSLPC